MKRLRPRLIEDASDLEEQLEILNSDIGNLLGRFQATANTAHMPSDRPKTAYVEDVPDLDLGNTTSKVEARPKTPEPLAPVPEQVTVTERPPTPPNSL